jgi:hypothetical protein
MEEGERKGACVAMIEAGVFRLPYEEVTVQVWHKDRPLLIWFKQVSAARGEYTVDARMMVRSDDGKWAIIPVDFRVNQAKKSSEFMVSTRVCDWVTSGVVANVAADWGAEEAIVYCQALAVDLTTLVLLTSTRGVVRTPVTPDRASVRLAKLRRVTPKFSHTLVELNKSLKTLAGKTYTVAGRKIPRIHWRRGHSRTLKSGKQTWVSAHLVGHDDQGRVSHDYSL